jgi:hypothetical protein
LLKNLRKFFQLAGQGHLLSELSENCSEETISVSSGFSIMRITILFELVEEDLISLAELKLFFEIIHWQDEVPNGYRRYQGAFRSSDMHKGLAFHLNFISHIASLNPEQKI